MTPTLTARNGRLPDDELVVVDTGPNGPQRLHVSVAPLWAGMLAAGMPAGCLRSGYRTRAQQQHEVDRANAGLTPSAAPVGSSFHGEGIAADVDEPARTWVRTWGEPHGVILDTVAREPWHMLLDPTRSTSTPPPPPTPTTAQTFQEEDDMKDYVIALYVLLLGRMPDATGLSDAIYQLTTGKKTPADIEASIRGSDEYQKLDPNLRVSRRQKLGVW